MHFSTDLSTLLALVGLLPCVDSVMYYKVAFDTEALTTLLVLQGFLPCVNSLIVYNRGVQHFWPLALCQGLGEGLNLHIKFA